MRKVLLITLLFMILLPLSGEVLFRYSPDPLYSVIERSNYRVRQNGSYKGHVYREHRAVMNLVSSDSGGALLKGTFYVLEEMKRDGTLQASPRDEICHASYRLFPNGVMDMDKRAPYPILRSFPHFPDSPVGVGESWESVSEMMIHTRGGETRVPLLCSYVFNGQEVYQGREVLKIYGKYALRYNGEDKVADGQLKRVSGTHDVDLLFDKVTGTPILFRTRLSENYLFLDGVSEERSGFILTFFKGIHLMEKGNLVRDITSALKGKSSSPILVEERDDGVVLTLDSLNFQADRAILLREDIPLLDAIAPLLIGAEGRTILVTGHTANIGSVESQKKLSIERAKTIVDELTDRGVENRRFIYRGLGGSEPTASNENEEGRGKNRRVEIMILQD